MNAGPPTGALDPSNNKTYDYIKGMLEDMLAYFDDTMVHLGGDEVQLDCWRNNTNISNFMAE